MGVLEKNAGGAPVQVAKEQQKVIVRTLKKGVIEIDGFVVTELDIG